MTSNPFAMKCGLTVNSPRTNLMKEKVKDMMRNVWHDDDVQPPAIDSESKYVDIISEFSRRLGYNLSHVLSLLNAVDFAVSSLIDYSTNIVISNMSNKPTYDDIKLFALHQAASEIIHQKVYTTQFNLLTKSEEREELNRRALELLQPLADLALDQSSTEKYGTKAHKLNVLLCTSIECVIIPLVFNIINDFKEIEINYHEKDKDHILANEVIQVVLTANRFILRDEMDHVSGGCILINEMMKEDITIEDVHRVIDYVKRVLINCLPYMIHSDNDNSMKKSLAVMDIMANIFLDVLKGKEVHFDQYPELSMIKATIPTIDGFFYGIVTAYMTGNSEYKSQPVIE